MIIDKIYDILIDKYLFYAYVSDYKIIVTLGNFSISFIWHSLWFNWDNNYNEFYLFFMYTFFNSTIWLLLVIINML